MKKSLTSLVILMSLISYAHANDYRPQIKERQNAFEQIESQSDDVEDLIDDANWDELEKVSLSLSQHSHALLTLFPQGSHEGSKAKESVWTNPDKFNTLLTKMDEGFQELYQASQQHDRGLAEDGLEKAQDTCNSCHRSYRSRW